MQYISAESVTEGHPDKLCDQISDSILDELLKIDPKTRAAVEVLTTTNRVVVAGEVTTEATIDLEQVVRDTIVSIGYTSNEVGLDGNTCQVDILLHEQSPDIAQGVNQGSGLYTDQGAGDQGSMYGYATDETKEYMPLPIHLAHQLTQQLTYLRKEAILPRLRPDGKAQVTVVYDQGFPVRLDTIVVSTQHTPEISHQEIVQQIKKQLIEPVCADRLDEKTVYHINPTGRFIIGGPHGDAGLTGRKIIVDTYGGVGRHGGGAFSGKDPSKVDRSAAYMARYLAKHIVASGLAKKCELQLSYAIGVAQPVSIYVDTFQTGKLTDRELATWLLEHLDLTPTGIIQTLDLLKPVYRKTAAYGHFGREEFRWEQLDSLNLFSQLVD